MSSPQPVPKAAPVVRSFVDLRAFADSEAATVPVALAGGEDPFLVCRSLLPTAEGPVTVGVLQLPPGWGKVASMPADEFLIVHKGRVTLEADGRALALEPDASVVGAMARQMSELHTIPTPDVTPPGFAGRWQRWTR